MGLLAGKAGKHIEFLSSTFDKYEEDSMILASEALKKKVVTSIRELAKIATSHPLSELDELRALAVLGKWAEYGYFTAVMDAAEEALPQIREAASSGNPNVIAEIARTERDPSVREAAVRNLVDQEVLNQIAKTDDDPIVRIRATERVTDQTVLAEVATTDRSAGVRIGAVERLDDQALLEALRVTESTEDLVPLEVGKIADVREAASKRLRQLRGQ